MKTLIFDGSPRKNGDTAALIAAFTEKLVGEYTVIRAYDRLDISPCLDCRYCWDHPGCALQDGMQEIYRLIEESDCIVIASPLYYSELTGPLLSLLSRLQVYYCARKFQGIRLIKRPKCGAVLLAGGGDGGPEQAIRTAKMLLRSMGAGEIADPVMSLHTNEIPAREDRAALESAGQLGGALHEFMK